MSPRHSHPSPSRRIPAHVLPQDRSRAATCKVQVLLLFRCRTLAAIPATRQPKKRLLPAASLPRLHVTTVKGHPLVRWRTLVIAVVALVVGIVDTSRRRPWVQPHRISPTQPPASASAPRRIGLAHATRSHLLSSY